MIIEITLTKIETYHPDVSVIQIHKRQTHQTILPREINHHHRSTLNSAAIMHEPIQASVSPTTAFTHSHNNIRNIQLPILLNQTVISMSLFHFHHHTNEPSIWIFGYGSLQWYPGFEYRESRKAELPNFARRFWHGNTMHRGTDQLPGRVVTIIEQHQSVVTGLLFRVQGTREINAALKHLYYREVDNGYDYETIDVHAHHLNGNKEPIHALTCIAREQNEYFVGHAEDEHIAETIATAKGVAGPNHEYLLKLANITRELFPHFYDEHLYKLEVLVRERLAIQQVKHEL